MRQIKYILGIFVLAFIVASIFGVTGLLGLGSAGVILAVGAIVADSSSVQNAKAKSPDLDKDYISNKVSVMKPSRYPLDTILRDAGSVVDVPSIKTSYFAVDTKPFNDTVTTGYTKSGDGVVSTDLVVGNIDMWSVDDTLLAYAADGSGSLKGAQDNLALVLYVTAINRAQSKITVQALNGDSGSGTTAGKIVVPTIANGTKLFRLGNAKSEKDIQDTPYTAFPADEYNYCQSFMAQIEETTWQAMHEKNANWSFSDLEALNIYDMRAKIESSFLWGYRTKFNDVTEQDEKYTCGGIRRFITKVFDYTNTGITQSDYINMTKTVFAGNGGSDVRIAFIGKTLLAGLSTISDFQRQVGSGNTEIVKGVTFRKIETNFGVLYIKHHPMFDLRGWDEAGIVIDPANIEKHVFKRMESLDLDLKKAGVRNVDARVINEVSCPILRYPDTHCLIRKSGATLL